MLTRSGARAAAFWARRDIRRRWPSLVLLGVLVGVTAAFALSAWAGARRTATALERLSVQTNASDAVAFPSQVDVPHPDWARLAARPEVTSVAVWDLLFGNYDNEPGALIFGSANGTYLGKVDKPVVVRGRMFNPRSPNEVVVDENAVKAGTPLGSTFKYQFYAPNQPEETGAPHGPTLTMHVVGVVREVPEFLFVTGGQILLSPAFMERYGSQVTSDENADIVLRHGAADMAALRHDVDSLVARGAPVLDVHATSRRVNTTLSVETTALLLLAAAIFLGGAILVAQVLGRSAATITDDAPALRAVGMSRSQLGLATGLSHLIPAAVGVPVTFGVALLISPHFPVGLGRRIDPGVGYHVDWTVIGPGMAFVVVVVIAASVLIGQGPRAGSLREQSTQRARGTLRRWAPVAVGLGATMAFESGSGRRRIPVIPALLAAVVAVMGVVASLTLDRGITTALDHPELAGVTWDASVSPVQSAETGRNVSAQLASRARTSANVRAVGVVDRDVINVDNLGAPLFAVRPVTGESTTPITFTIISGHAPRNRDEASIGPATAKDLHVGIGDTVSVGATHARVRIVGESLFPNDVHSEFDEGLWLTPTEHDALVAAVGPKGSLTDDRVVAVQFAPHTSLFNNIEHLQARVGDLSYDVSPPEPPDELTNLQNVRSLPEVLAAFLGFIAIAALGAVLLSCARRRGPEFAVLRALGMTRRDVHTILNSLGTVIGIVGLVVGIPVGLAVGRLGWQSVADRVPLAVIPPLALAAALLLIPVTLVVANLLALWPGRVAVSHPPAVELRTE